MLLKVLIAINIFNVQTLSLVFKAFSSDTSKM